MLSEHILDLLGDYFVEQRLERKGWKFHEFVDEWQQGYITIQQK